ncbi:MAG: N-acetylmuramoyl-L-alanine amidase family protein [Bacteroidales bacterium]
MTFKKSRWIIFFLLLILLDVNLFAKKPTRNSKINLVVIDAGHGGHDPGAIGSKLKEKDVVLAIALKLGKLIESNFSDVKVIYTRKTDEFIELYRRAKIANENHADLFISIHCNSTKSKESYGTETWVMGLSKSKSNLEVAKKENAAILLEDNYSASYDGFDPNSPEANIIFSLFQNAYLDQSLDLAAKVQKHFRNNIKTIDRGVKQEGFLVLYKTTMPAILIETGFVSNLKEEEFLASDKGKNDISKSIFDAFKEYKFKIEGFNNQAKILTPKEDEKNIALNNIDKSDTLKITNASKKEISFRVQFATSATEKPVSSPEFSNLKNVKKYYHGNLYKYTVGDEQDIKEANKLLIRMQEKGFKDAFLVAFLNGERISPTQAIKLLNEK